MSPAPERSWAGFTLIEVMVVLAIIGTLATLVAPAVFRHVGDANATAARSQIEMLSMALEAYRLDRQTYPTTDDGLAALRSPPPDGRNAPSWRGPYVRKAVPVDPWGRPYVYRATNLDGVEGFELFTLGRDGVVGGEGEDADITGSGDPVRQ